MWLHTEIKLPNHAFEPVTEGKILKQNLIVGGVIIAFMANSDKEKCVTETE